MRKLLWALVALVSLPLCAQLRVGSGGIRLGTPANNVPSYTAAALPSSPVTGQMAWVTDAASPSGCTEGLGTIKVLCRWSGTAWEVASSDVNGKDITPRSVTATQGITAGGLFCLDLDCTTTFYRASAGRVATPGDFVAQNLYGNGANVSNVDASLFAGQTPAQFRGLTAKGDIRTFDGTNPQTLPVGANNLCLTSDSTQALGMKWATCPGGGATALNQLTDTANLSGATDLQALVYSAALGKWVPWTLQPAAAWPTITDKPNTLAGYGITNGVATSVTVNGHALSGNVTVSKSDVGLPNADNTTDNAKPVSTAQQTALDLKANDSAALHKTGAETKSSGVLTVVDGITIGTGTNAFEMTPKDQSADPTVPSAGYTNVYSKGGQLCSQSPAGTVICGGMSSAPTIPDFTYATHSHGNAAGGGQLAPQTAFPSAKLSGNADLLVTAGTTRTAGKQAQFDASGNLIASAYDVGDTSAAQGFVPPPPSSSTICLKGVWSADASYNYACYDGDGSTYGAWVRTAADTAWTGSTASYPTFSPWGDSTYFNDQTVSLTTATPGASICFRSDGVNPAATTAGTCDGGSTAYSGPIAVNVNNTNLRALTTKTGYTNSAIISRTYGLQVATPTATPAAGTVSNGTSVGFSSSTTSATFHYTTDGTTPTCSTGTTGSSYTVIGSTTLKAVGCKSNYADSGLLTAAYTIPVGAQTITSSVLKASTSVASNANPPVTVTLASTSDLLIWCVAGNRAANYVVGTPTDGAANTWTTIGTRQDTGTSITASCWSTVPSAPGSLTITGHITGTQSASADRQYITVLSLHGSAATPTLDGVNTSAVTSSSNWTMPSVSVGTTGDRLFYFGDNAATPLGYTAGTGFTMLDCVTCSTNAARSFLMWSDVGLDAGTQSGSVTTNTAAAGVFVGWAVK